MTSKEKALQYVPGPYKKMVGRFIDHHTRHIAEQAVEEIQKEVHLGTFRKEEAIERTLSRIKQLTEK